MSLLIKALASAEKGKQVEREKSGKAAMPENLALAPISPAERAEKTRWDTASGNRFSAASTFEAGVAVAGSTGLSAENKSDSQKTAANVFVANQAVQSRASAVTLFILGAVGALVVWLVLQGYRFISEASAPPAAVVRPAPLINSAAPAATVTELPPSRPSSLSSSIQADSRPSAAEVTVNSALPSGAGRIDGEAGKDKAAFAMTDMGARVRRTVAPDDDSGSSMNESAKNRPLKLFSSVPSASVDPVLLAAYDAYARGDNTGAQQQYRQVLQSDERNVDALLGMAAIALRQSRYGDASGWYRKVLEVEPANSIALAAIARPQISAEPGEQMNAAAGYSATESRIKNMLVQHPEAATLHAALGNLYAGQNQWPLAQAAYFDASRLAPDSADYAFNLAVSLDHLGKTALALAQYQRALDLLTNSANLPRGAGAASFDRTQLEARMQTLWH